MESRSIGNVSEKIVERIRKEYGTPAYIFDEVSFMENLERFLRTFRKYYPKFNIAYSYKTNYAPYICGLVKSVGGLAEVVSDFEYYAARKAGNGNDKIIFNGPLKKELFCEHLLSGGAANLDNYQECERAASLADQNRDSVIRVGLRVNIDIGQDYVSRFGMDPDSAEFSNALALLNSRKNVRLCGLHCHVGEARSLKNWERRAKKMLDLADRMFPFGPPEYLDLGGNMFGDMEPVLKEQFEEQVPSYEEYAGLVGGLFREHYADFSETEKPFLYLEPGTPLVCRYMWLLTTIVSHKEIHGKLITGVDSSFFEAGEMSRENRLPIRIFNKARDFIVGDLAGYTCLDYDVLYPGYEGCASIGDLVLLGDAGGYSFVFKPPFIMPDIPIAALKQDGSLQLIKRRQTYEDLLSLFL